MTSVPDIVRATIAERALSCGCAPIVLLVSGGADSMTLLHLAAEGLLGEGPLSVLHVNHLLRGAEAEADEAFVVAQADALGIACTAVRVDVAALAANEGLNLEDAGREVRYRLADDAVDAACDAAGVARDKGRIATGHTLDDRIETLIGRLVDGSGAGALRSIRHRRGRIVRPLLDVGRAEIRSYLVERGEVWREDATNDDTERRRAFVRAAVLPAFEQLNPAFRANLRRTMDLVADEDDLLADMARAFARDFGSVEPGARATFERRYMETLSRPMARRTLREGLSRAFPHASRLEAAHVEALVDALPKDRFARDLPFGLRAEVVYGTLEITRADPEVAVIEPALLSVPGSADLGPAGRLVAEEADVADRGDGVDSVVVDGDSLTEPLVVDGVRSGDRMRVLGMAEGTRSLADILTDAKVPRRERSAVPVVRSGEQVVWLAGLRMSELHKVGDGTVRAVRLTWERAR